MKKTINTISIAIIMLAVSVSLFGQIGTLPADLNETFGVNGNGITTTGNHGITKDIFIDAADHIYVNHTWSFTIHKPDGFQIAAKDCPYSCFAMALRNDGYIVAVGTSNSGELAIQRFTPNLDLDPTFGNGGIVLTRIRASSLNKPDAVLFVGNSIVIAGTIGDSPIPNRDQFVAKFDNAGNIDPTFGQNGSVIEKEIFFSSLAIQGKNVVVGGYSFSKKLSTIVVYDGQGQREPSFNNGQIFSIFCGFPKISIQSRGNIVFGCNNIQNQGFSGLVRLTVNGQFDPSFGNNGIALFPVNNYTQIQDVKIDVNGRIILAGYWYNLSQNALHRKVIGRFKPNGTLDSNFSTTAPPIFPFTNQGLTIFENYNNFNEKFSAIGLQSTGKIVAANTYGGHAGITTNEIYQFNGN